jgi:hypothetical protein
MGIARIYRSGLPYAGDQLAGLDYEQTTDTLYLAHLNHPPSKLVRFGNTDWRFSNLTFGPAISAPRGVTVTADVPNQDAGNGGENFFPQTATYVVTAVSDDTGQESRASASGAASNDLTLKRNYNTISWDAVTGASRYNVYKANNSQFFGYIGTTENVTFRDDNIGPALDRTPPNAENPFDVAGNWPSTVALHEQRLIWGRTDNVPNGIWGSRIGVSELENFDRARPAIASDAFSMAIVSRKVNPINQLISSGGLMALTSSAVFNVDGDGNGGVIVGNSPPSARREISRGATRLPAIAIDNTVFHASSVGYAVRAIGFSFEIDGNKSDDVTIFSPHFFEGFEIVDWAYAAEPRSVIWGVRSDGKLLAFTWEQEQNVWGWTLCETAGKFKSVCVVSEQGEDRAYFVVEREIDGHTKFFVERLSPHMVGEDNGCCWLDCSIKGSFDTPRGTFGGLWHLEGETVSAQADGAVYEGLVVNRGAVTLPNGETARKVVIGLPYTVLVETLPFRVMTEAGSNMGRRQQPGDVVLKVRNTSNIKAGIPGKLFPVKQRLQEAGKPLGFLNGTTTPITTANKAQDEIIIQVEQTLPSPFEMLAIAIEPVVNE